MVKQIWYWENMDNKILMKILKVFDQVTVLEFRGC